MVQLKTQVLSFMETQKKNLGFTFHDKSWWQLFLSELFDKLNNFKYSLQRPWENIITATSKLPSLYEKLTLLKAKVPKEMFYLFLTLNESSLKKEIAPEKTSEEFWLSVYKTHPTIGFKAIKICCHLHVHGSASMDFLLWQE